MKNVFFVVVALLCATTLSAQQPDFWGDDHPEDTHNHQNGNGHDGNGNSGHNGWGYGHHNTPPPPPPPPQDDCGDPSAPVPEPGTMLLFGTGMAAAAYVSRRRKANQAK